MGSNNVYDFDTGADKTKKESVIDRIARVAFETIRKQGRKLCTVDKANVYLMQLVPTDLGNSYLTSSLLLKASMLWRQSNGDILMLNSPTLDANLWTAAIVAEILGMTFPPFCCLLYWNLECSPLTERAIEGMWGKEYLLLGLGTS
ncbi:hypothetical protein LOK49_LG08G00648 [Camellia lanceoleosa]|uniref:Uncharacterized protein n=1 Tax=Camellia lanceoleosa TaxID=1840588 RepID=A0ACC0GPZ2_9ERIC|nr:hypothetical protein LOK49_LG08G00648 [Camellia lanceoleosa]